MGIACHKTSNSRINHHQKKKEKMPRTANCHHVMKIKTNCEEETQKYFLEAMTYKPKHNEVPSS